MVRDSLQKAVVANFLLARNRFRTNYIATFLWDSSANQLYSHIFVGQQCDKVKEFNIQMQSIPNADIQIPLHSKLAICCSLKDYVEVGDHYLYICNVESVYANDTETAVYAWNGYAEIRPANKG